MAYPQNQHPFPPAELEGLVNNIRRLFASFNEIGIAPDSLLLTENDSAKLQAWAQQFGELADEDKLRSVVINGLELRTFHMSPWQEQALNDLDIRASLLFQAVEQVYYPFHCISLDERFVSLQFQVKTLLELPWQMRHQGLRDMFEKPASL